MTPVDSLLQQLHDIEGLDAIPSWPLALGWRMIIGLGIIIIALAAWYLIQWVRFRRSWKYDTLKKLNELLDDLSRPAVTDEKVRSAATLFSEYMRRIALRRFSRNTCAGLTGKAWLTWLSENDAKNFDWASQGQLLIHAPYAPASYAVTADQLKLLIQAAKEWVC
jgi:Domain of unknown function (DUF4381)